VNAGSVSLAILQAERSRDGANIQTFGDALWWAITTVTTVGYGDQYPVTVEGRLIAVGLMLSGVALIGVVTATFASWLVQRVEEVEEESRAATHQDIQILAAELAEIRAALDSGQQQH
jgi:voltage-gated potassium channel